MIFAITVVELCFVTWVGDYCIRIHVLFVLVTWVGEEEGPGCADAVLPEFPVLLPALAG